MRVELISLVGIFRKELFSSGVQRRGSWAVIQPIKMIGGGKDERCVRGLECVGCVSELCRSSLGCDMTVSTKGVPQPTGNNRDSQSDN